MSLTRPQSDLDFLWPQLDAFGIFVAINKIFRRDRSNCRLRVDDLIASAAMLEQRLERVAARKRSHVVEALHDHVIQANDDDEDSQNPYTKHMSHAIGCTRHKCNFLWPTSDMEIRRLRG